MLHRSSVLTVATLLGGALLVSVPATAAGETCQGRPATIVGTGPDIQGTPGDDVIVTGASSRTDAGAGDDLVCVSSSDHGSVFVFAGDGDDVVDASASNPTWVLRTVYLGTGLDHYVGNVGGPTQGDVHANGADDNVADATTVLLQVTDALTGPLGTYSGGLIQVWSADHDVEIEVDEHIVVAGRVAADITGFNRVLAVAPRVILRGNSQDNSLLASGCHVHLMGKGGDDYLSGSSAEGAPRFDCVSEATMRGGSGDDQIKGWLGRNRLIGNAGDDVLQGRPRDDVLLGGSGHDELSGGSGADVLRGNQGRDTLRGSPGRDVLLGNQGRDSADGDQGRDACVAERELRCER